MPRRQFPLWRATLVEKRKLAKANRMNVKDDRIWEYRAVSEAYIFEADGISEARRMSAYRFGFNPRDNNQQRLIEDRIEVLPV